MKHVAEAFRAITTRCRDRATWIQGIVRTISRIDKNVLVIGIKQGVEVHKSNPGDTVRGIITGCSAEDDFDGIANIDEKFGIDK